jgi:hypothetical protein
VKILTSRPVRRARQVLGDHVRKGQILARYHETLIRANTHLALRAGPFDRIGDQLLNFGEAMGINEGKLAQALVPAEEKE